MLRMRRLLLLLALPALLAVSACGDDEDGAGSSASAPTEAAAPADACAKDRLPLKTPGRLTVGTDKPAYPPYFEDDDPANGRGFESATAYAIARELGFAKEEVRWVTVPFNSSYAPGPKDFDFDVNQISITPQRARRVDFSEPYFTAPQAVVAANDSPAAGATSLAELGQARIGVQVGTTSLDAVQDVVKPAQEPRVYNDSNDVVSAIKQGQVDAVVVDLPTAFYLTAAELEDAKIVGQFAAPGGDEWGALLEKDSGLTDCVSQAIRTLKESGELQRIQDASLGGEAAPELR